MLTLLEQNSDDSIQEPGWNLGGQTMWFKGTTLPNSNDVGSVECTVRGKYTVFFVSDTQLIVST